MATTVPGTATGVETHTSPLPASFKHPLDPLTPEEIAAVSLVVRQHAVAEGLKAIKFITNYLLPPPKRAVLAYLGIPLAPGSKPEPAVPIVRKAEIDFLDVVAGASYNAVAAFDNGKWSVISCEKLPEGVQPQISVDELILCETIVRADPKVRELAKAVGVAPDQIYCDGWSIGYDDRFPKNARIQQALVFARLSQHENLYAHPMDFIPIVDANANKVLHIDIPPHYTSSPNGPVLSVKDTKQLPLDVAATESASGRPRIAPPMKRFDFLPDLISESAPNFKTRDDLKPIHIVQPEGVSFTMDGNELSWQNWKMHIAFSHREGIALSTITYNDHGEIRPIIYRLSLAEMVVPYGAPEFPHPRKFAFDTGEYGMGTMANELSLGCDCVGQIHYLPGAFVGNNGAAIVIKNVICIHEEDSGVLWKHSDYRPDGRSQTVRRRRLVVSMVCTLANYEYIWNYMFYQDGSIELETRLTGILQVYVAQDGEPNKYGTLVAPRVNAHYHQHLFSFRIDPMIDGLNNTVVETDVIAGDDTGSANNFAGNAFYTETTPVKKETGRLYDFEKERKWSITNPARKHYSSGKDVAYALHLKGGLTPLMARQTGWVGKRATFTQKPIWVVKDVEDDKGSRMWPAGKYVPQTRESPADSLGEWVAGEKDVENEDLLVYVTVGVTHIPRPEDWPVMPVEHLSISLKPQSFFTMNPSMDVPGTRDAKSVPAFDGKEGDCCH